MIKWKRYQSQKDLCDHRIPSKLLINFFWCPFIWKLFLSVSPNFTKRYKSLYPYLIVKSLIKHSGLSVVHVNFGEECADLLYLIFVFNCVRFHETTSGFSREVYIRYSCFTDSRPYKVGFWESSDTIMNGTSVLSLNLYIGTINYFRVDS